MRKPLPARTSAARWWLGAALVAGSLALLVPAVDGALLAAAARRVLADPLALAAVLTAYAGAFALRAALWRRVLPGLGFGQALAALHVSLAGNHVLPLRLGEVLRVTSVVRRTPVPLAAAAASTLGLRAADVLAVVGLVAIIGPGAAAGLTASAAWLLALPAAAVWAAGAVWLRRLERRHATGSPGAGPQRVPGAGPDRVSGACPHGAVRPVPSAAVRAVGPVVLVGAAGAWVLESALVWQAARWAGFGLAPAEAVLVTAVTIAAQVLAVAPGGIGTYEAAATAAMVTLGAPAPAALAAAVTAHAVKTVYALASGTVAAVVPAPGLLGRLRLPRHPPPRPPSLPPAPDAPVVLFLPARDEAAVVGGVVARVPAVVLGRQVVTVVVDDGSADATAQLAEQAGARVVRLGANRGLGAAVRRGLAEAVALGAAAVAFCDADAEYAPEELAALVAPILDGRADYVVGSRFAGRVERMLPHRRLGNRVLTAVLRWVARVPLTDGQSGYRALSAAAAADAELVHDYNYAQVLTLDLLAKGHRYAEAPISYRFRTTGRSYIRLGRYLRRVAPAVWRELNAPPAVGPSTSGVSADADRAYVGA